MDIICHLKEKRKFASRNLVICFQCGMIELFFVHKQTTIVKPKT